MKKLFFLTAILFAALAIKAQNVPVAEKIIYNVKIKDAEHPENTNVYDNIGESQRMFFINNVMEAVKTGKIKAYEDESFTKVLSLNEIDNMLVIKDTAYVPDPNDASKEIMVAVEEEIANEEFTAVYFMESWSFDKNTLNINKQIIAIAPLLEMMVDSEDGGEVLGHKLLFWIKL